MVLHIHPGLTYLQKNPTNLKLFSRGPDAQLFPYGEKKISLVVHYSISVVCNFFWEKSFAYLNKSYSLYKHETQAASGVEPFLWFTGSAGRKRNRHTLQKINTTTSYMKTEMGVTSCSHPDNDNSLVLFEAHADSRGQGVFRCLICGDDLQQLQVAQEKAQFVSKMSFCTVHCGSCCC